MGKKRYQEKVSGLLRRKPPNPSLAGFISYLMNTLTKSPMKVAREALAVGAHALPRYSHTNSPKKFTLPQLFSCLVLKTFFKTDYRGIEQLLVDLPDLRNTLRLAEVPHFTTLHKAARRLLKLRLADRLV